jgi:hypothetical protein
MTQLQGPPAELRMTIEVKRAATGQTEVFELIGTPIPEPEQEQPHGSDSQHGGA